MNEYLEMFKIEKDPLLKNILLCLMAGEDRQEEIHDFLMGLIGPDLNLDPPGCVVRGDDE